MPLPVNPPAIVWTQIFPALTCQRVDASQISADVQAIRAWLSIEKDLLEIKDLQSDWDGFGADPVPLSVWDRAYFFLRMFRDIDVTFPPKRVALSPDGVIGFEWTKGESYIRADISDSTKVRWMFAAEGKDTVFVVEPLMKRNETASREHTWQPGPDVVGAHDLAYAR
jgi:hypothetical protein